MPIDAAQLAYLQHLAAEDGTKQGWIRTLREYMVGEQPVYLTDRQKEFIGLKEPDAKKLFSHNLCQLVVSAPVERLDVTGFGAVKVTGEDGMESEVGDSVTLTRLASAWWEQNRMDAGQDDVYEAACRDGEAFLIVDWHELEQRPRWTVHEAYDGTQGMKIHYDPDTDAPLFASLRWQTSDPMEKGSTGKTRVTLYFPDRIEKYISKGGDPTFEGDWDTIIDFEGDPDNGIEPEPWPLPWVGADRKPLGLPVMHFENPGGSEIADLIPIQDMVNKSDLDLIATADMSGFRLLWLSGVAPIIDVETGEEKTQTISPMTLLRLTDPQARAGAIEPADLTKMTDTSRYWIESAAGVTRTPHFLLRASGADQPSGESLKMQETGLVAKVLRKQKVFGNVWEDAVYLSARLTALKDPGGITDARLQTRWADPETRNEVEQSQIAERMFKIGVPLPTILSKVYRMTQEEIDEVMDMVKTTQADEINRGLDEFESRFNSGLIGEGAGNGNSRTAA
jgi:hypothetical protein